MSKYVIIDLEMCNVPKSKKSECKCGNEIIQIGAVIVDEQLEICDKFVTLVSPEFGVVDKRIYDLTGIRQRDLKGAPCIKDALEMFMAWLPEDAVIVSWSDNDQIQLHRETRVKGIVIEGLQELIDSWIDCQQTFAEKMNNDNKNYRLSEALIIADIDYDEGAHDALVDALNTAQLFIKMEREPVLVLSPYYRNLQQQQKPYNPFAELLGKYEWAC